MFLSQNTTSLNRQYSVTRWVFFFCFLWFLIFLINKIWNIDMIQTKHWYTPICLLFLLLHFPNLNQTLQNLINLPSDPSFASPTSPNHHLFSTSKILRLKPFTRFRLAFTMSEYWLYTLFLACRQIGDWNRSSFKD